MNAKILSKVIEVEKRVNTICKCLVLGEADHFNVEYTSHRVSITAFCYKKERNDNIAELMLIWANPEDKLKLEDYSKEEVPFWTSTLTIVFD